MDVDYDSSSALYFAALNLENNMSIYAILLIYACLVAWFAYEVYRAPLMEFGDE